MGIPLTNYQMIEYLLTHCGGGDMVGTIRAKGVCPVCAGKFSEVKKLGFVCPTCKTVPSRYYIDLFYQGKRIRLFSDKQGQPLDTYQRALNLLAHINHELKNYTFDPTQYIKSELQQFWVSTLLERFISYKLEHIAPSYQKKYERMAELAKTFFTTKDVREIRKLDIINYQTHLEKACSMHGKTLKNYMDFFKTFLRYIKDTLEIPVTVPTFPDVDYQQKQFIWLNGDDQLHLFNNIQDEHKPIIAFLMLHGCRPGEARALKCKDVNIQNGIVTISATWSGKVYREKRKGKKSRAVINPIHPEMSEYLTNRVRNNFPESFIFINPNTERYYTESALMRVWEQAKSKAGITKELRLYDATRHSFASQLINSGVSLISVSRLLGHSSVKMTEKYAHSNIESLRVGLSNLTLTVTNLSLEAKLKDKSLIISSR